MKPFIRAIMPRHPPIQVSRGPWLILATGLLVLPFLRAEPVLFTTEGTSLAKPHILTVAQIGSAVEVVGTLESVEEQCGTTTPLYTTLDLDCPALAVRQVDHIDYGFSPFTPSRGPDQILYTQGRVLAAYDPARGDGWVNNPLFGWIWIADYPWFFVRGEGWLYCDHATVNPSPAPAHYAYTVYSFRTQEWTVRE